MKAINFYEVLKYLSKEKLSSKKRLNLKILSNFSTFQLEIFLKFFLSKKNINLNVLKSEYDQIEQQLMDKKINKNIDILVIMNDFNAINKFSFRNFSDYSKVLERQLLLADKLKKRSPKIKVIFFHLNRSKKTFNQKKITNINNQIIKKSKKLNIFNFDIFKILKKYQYEKIYNKKNFKLSGTLYSEKVSAIIANELSSFMYSFYNVKKKCLVIDLDNTLWGGIIGEDKLSKIEFSNSGKGLHYKNFQIYLKNLLKKGVILAISSKNNFQDVKDFFKRKKMILKLNDFSIVKANWEPKYKNVNEICKDLNIGKDSVVFFDDSPFEREQMKKLNPKINLIEVPNNPKDYINAIEQTSFFYSRNITNEDLKKKKQYDIIRKTKNFQTSFSNHNEFLKQLKMKLFISEIKKKNFLRSLQMINKINQFNLTAKRLDEQQFREYLKKNETISILGSLSDKFGDHGLTALILGKKLNSNIQIDFFLLSCRILGRNVEKIILNEFLLKAKKSNVKKVYGFYKKTNKNVQCKQFYLDNKFKKINNSKFVFEVKNIDYKKNQLMRISNG